MEKILKPLDDLDARYGKWLILFVLIPFLYPRGFAEVSGLYKGLFTLWLYLAMAVILVWVLYDLFRNGWKNRWQTCAVVVYYLAFVVITMIVQGGISAGLQKMFSAPALYLFFFVCLRKDGERLLAAVARILSVIFVLNISVFAPPIAEKMLGIYHLNFLGHVQVGAQYGLLGVLVACMLLKLYPARRELAWVLMGTSLVTILWSETVVGYLVVAILAMGLVLQKAKRLEKLAWLQRVLAVDSRVFLVVYILIGVGLMAYSLTGLEDLLGGEVLSLNGRSYVWREGLNLLRKSPLLGFGAYGVQIKTFWGGAMNYAHSELLQQLLDGGILLGVVFCGMLWVLLSRVRRAENRDVVGVINIFLIAVLAVMLFESVTEYHYFTLVFSLAACLPEVCGSTPRVEAPDEEVT